MIAVPKMMIAKIVRMCVCVCGVRVADLKHSWLTNGSNDNAMTGTFTNLDAYPKFASNECPSLLFIHLFVCFF